MDAGMAPASAHGLVSFSSCVCLIQHTRTCQACPRDRLAVVVVLHVAAEVERLQVREVADRLRDGACAWAREFLCMSGSTHTHPKGHSCPKGGTPGS